MCGGYRPNRKRGVGEAVSTCKCFRLWYGKQQCLGTRELDECSCGGDTNKCNFYPEKREGGVSKPAPKKEYCKFCFNARIYVPSEEELLDPFSTELTDENDSSSCGVGCASPNYRFMVSSGHGKPVRIEVERWSREVGWWMPVGKYYPKYCPECGRKLDEYEG